MSFNFNGGDIIPLIRAHFLSFSAIRLLNGELIACALLFAPLPLRRGGCLPIVRERPQAHDGEAESVGQV